MGKDELGNLTYVIDLGPRPSLAVAGTDARFPVGRIYCVGRNYADHAREMGHDPDREPPFFFMKAANCIVESGSTISYPVGTKDVHHEIEMVAALAVGGKDIPVERALEHVWGYAVGLDMTRRDVQGEAKKLGRPWEMGKSFDESAPIGELHAASAIGHPSKGAIWLKVNGEFRQQGDLAMQIWSVPEQIAYLSRLITLQPGDLIFSGTPAGVGPIQAGDRLEGHVDGVGDLVVTYRK
ncbi:MAG TPA: fumarylacetoacetate hydrolase family protein [Usitatibacter sp.]|nr:fumarylacetoacetate hydrolase family protein [Usitatibacter sp.]